MRAFAKAPSAEPSRPGNGSTFSFGFLAAMLVCAAAFLGIGAPAASAAPEAEPGWSYQRTFGNLFIEPSFGLPYSPLAVDSGGIVFAIHSGTGRSRAYSSDGTFLGDYDFSGIVRNLAIDFSDDTVYADELFGGGSVRRWVSDGKEVPTYTEDTGFSSIPAGAGLAVDQTTGDVLVTDPGAEAVRRYDSTGALVDTIGTPSLSPSWIATAPDGSIFVAADGGADVTHLSGTGTMIGTIAVGGTLRGLSFDSVNEVLTASVGGMLNTYTPAGQLLSEVKGGSSVYGLANSQSSLLYEHAGNVINAYIFATFPGVDPPVVSNIQVESAHVEAEVDPGAGPPEGSVARFEYSEDGGESWTSTPNQSLSGLETIEADLEGLTLNSDFLVRVKASNALASKASSTTSFSTPEVAPVVVTGVASERSETSVVLNGAVNPAGQQTSYHFEYGTTVAYSSRVPVAAESPAGNQRVPRTVSKFISGLQPGTTYHYRLVAENAVGESVGVDRTFTTLTSSEAAPARAYEQVTPVDKKGAQVLSNGSVQAAADGSGIVVTLGAGPRDAQSAPIAMNYVARRGASNWQNWQQIDPPLGAGAAWVLNATVAVSDDLEHALVISNRELAPGGIAGSGNLYVRDLETDEYTFVGGAPGNDSYVAMMIQGGRIFHAGAPDFSWVVVTSEPPLLPEATQRATYRWSETDGLSIESRLEGEFVAPFPVDAIPLIAEYTNQVSPDGNAIAYGFGFAGVYLRDNGVTKALSVSRKPGDPTEPVPGYLDEMTPDGRYVFFHSPVPLTEDASEPSLYRYDTQTEELLYVTVARNTNGTVIYGVSDDGQTAYVDDGAKTVVWRDGQVKTVTTETPLPASGGGGTTRDGSHRVTADGRFFAWMTPFPDLNVKLYDAETEEVVCVSCPADGGPSGDARMTVGERRISNHQPRALLDDGTLFFDSPRRLVSADHNGVRDVYEYKEGRLSLITTGEGDFGAFFVDASEDGSDVFFQTDEGLVSQDVDGASDVYDARVGGGFASQNPPPPPAPCAGAACRPLGGGAAAGNPSLGSMNDSPERATISVSKVIPGSKAVKVKVKVNQAGRVKVSGSGVVSTSRGVASSGTYTVTAPLSKRARERLRAGKKVELSLKVSLSGGSSSASANYSRTLGK